MNPPENQSRGSRTQYSSPRGSKEALSPNSGVRVRASAGRRSEAPCLHASVYSVCKSKTGKGERWRVGRRGHRREEGPAESRGVCVGDSRWDPGASRPCIPAARAAAGEPSVRPASPTSHLPLWRRAPLRISRHPRCPGKLRSAPRHPAGIILAVWGPGRRRSPEVQCAPQGPRLTTETWRPGPGRLSGAHGSQLWAPRPWSVGRDPGAPPLRLSFPGGWRRGRRGGGPGTLTLRVPAHRGDSHYAQVRSAQRHAPQDRGGKRRNLRDLEDHQHPEAVTSPLGLHRVACFSPGHVGTSDAAHLHAHRAPSGLAASF